MASRRYKPGESGCPDKQFTAGNPHRWPSGISGNPAGVSKLRANFERAFTEALVSTGSAEEVALLLWKAARKGEAWAIQSLCQRFAPETRSLRIIQEDNHEQIDYSKLSDDQLEALDAILRQASVEPPPAISGEGSPATV